MSSGDPPVSPNDDVDELHARLAARQTGNTVHALSFILLGAGLLLAVAVAAMIVVAW